MAFYENVRKNNKTFLVVSSRFLLDWAFEGLKTWKISLVDPVAIRKINILRLLASQRLRQARNVDKITKKVLLFFSQIDKIPFLSQSNYRWKADIFFKSDEILWKYIKWTKVRAKYCNFQENWAKIKPCSL